MEHRMGKLETIKYVTITHNNRTFKAKLITNNVTNFVDIEIVCEPTADERIEITKYLTNYIGE